jgi:hypothetical protein
MLLILKYSSTLLRRNPVRQQNLLNVMKGYIFVKIKKTGPYEICSSGAANVMAAVELQCK